jgi:hypothetical protein
MERGENMIESLRGENIVVYDLEIKNPIDGKHITWNDHHLMGISVGVAFHYLTGELHVFMDDNLEELPKLLNQADIVSGFNILGFDNKLINATCATKYEGHNSYDMLLESRLAAGWKPNLPFPKGMRLDDHLEATFGKAMKKTEDGADAPKFWLEGHLGKLVSYCIADVRRECMLFEHVWAGRPVRTPTHHERVLRHPAALRKQKL